MSERPGHNDHQLVGKAPIILGIAMLMTLGGCVEAAREQQQSLDETGEVTMPASKDNAERGIPEGAINVADDLYMVPVGVDADACEQFALFSLATQTNQAIHYRSSDGSFAMGKTGGSCEVKMVSLGPDADGCEQFKAEPVDDLAPTAVVYYQTKKGTYVTNKSRSACG